jgi:hypothetical protein
MRSLTIARQTCEDFHPGLLASLEQIPFTERELPGSPVMDIYRRHRGPGRLVPPEYGGEGAGPLSAVRAQRGAPSARCGRCLPVTGCRLGDAPLHRRDAV